MSELKLKCIIFIYKWLPIFFGCHGRAERSFIIHNRKFPICARCTGEMFGIIFSIIVFQFIEMPSLMVSILILLPLIIDGFVQRLTSYESKNWKRFVTGFLFGIGLSVIFARFTIYLFDMGLEIGYWMQR